MGRLSSDTDEAGLPTQNDVLEAHAQFCSYLHNGYFSSAERGSINVEPLWSLLVEDQVRRL